MTVIVDTMRRAVLRDNPTEAGAVPDADELAPTRWSLIARLKRWDDGESWREFFDVYWRLIYKAGRRAGLTHVEAEEMVQETVIGVSRRMERFEASPLAGSFKNWLLTLTQWRIIDQMRKRGKHKALRMHGRGHGLDGNGEALEKPIEEEIPDPLSNALEEMWNREWQNNLLHAALEKLKNQVAPKQFQMFYLHVVREEPVQEVMTSLKVSRSQVYLSKLRVGRVFRRIARDLEQRYA